MGAITCFPLKRRLGEHLANRINAGHLHGHVVGRLGDLLIAEFPVHNTPLVGRTLREARLREAFGLSVVAVWERGRLIATTPDTRLSDGSVPVVMGSGEQMTNLDAHLVTHNTNYNPVLAIGGGKVGCATALTLRSRAGDGKPDRASGSLSGLPGGNRRPAVHRLMRPTGTPSWAPAWPRHPACFSPPTTTPWTSTWPCTADG